jgi:hypothetical protein
VYVSCYYDCDNIARQMDRPAHCQSVRNLHAKPTQSTCKEPYYGSQIFTLRLYYDPIACLLLAATYYVSRRDYAPYYVPFQAMTLLHRMRISSLNTVAKTPIALARFISICLLATMNMLDHVTDTPELLCTLKPIFSFPRHQVGQSF